MKKLIKYLIITVATLFMIGLLIPEWYQMLCGTTANYNHQDAVEAFLVQAADGRDYGIKTMYQT